MDETKLLKLKKEIQETKESMSEDKGQLQFLMKQLKTDYGCNTIAEAEKLLESNKKEIEKLSKKFEKGCEELEEKYKS